MIHKFPELPYEYNSLEPTLDEETMKVHHDKHHKKYFDTFLEAIKNYPELQEKPIEEILKNLNDLPEEIKQKVINHGGGYFNHSFFWEILKKDTKFEGKIKELIEKSFGNYEEFKKEFTDKSIGLFGSGWTWLVLDNNELKIVQTKNQDSVISQGLTPLIAIDLWEHAYYLKYQNRRPEYVEEFFKIINWEKVNELLESKK